MCVCIVIEHVYRGNMVSSTCRLIAVLDACNDDEKKNNIMTDPGISIRSIDTQLLAMQVLSPGLSKSGMCRITQPEVVTSLVQSLPRKMETFVQKDFPPRIWG